MAVLLTLWRSCAVSVWVWFPLGGLRAVVLWWLAWCALGAVALPVSNVLTRSIFSHLSDFIPWAVTCRPVDL